MLPHIADYLHKLDYTFSWIPYYGWRGYDVWQQFGFDQVYLQPNYYWKPQNDIDERLQTGSTAWASAWK